MCPFRKHVLHLSNTNHVGDCNNSSSHSIRISLQISVQHHRRLNEMLVETKDSIVSPFILFKD